MFHSYSFSLSTAEDSKAALEAVMGGHSGQAPDASFLCAGGSKPKFWAEMSSQELTDGMNMGYWVQAWSAWVFARDSLLSFVTHYPLGYKSGNDKAAKKRSLGVCLLDAGIHVSGWLRFLFTC